MYLFTDGKLPAKLPKAGKAARKSAHADGTGFKNKARFASADVQKLTEDLLLPLARLND